MQTEVNKIAPEYGDYHPTYEEYLKQVLGIYSDPQLERFLNLPPSDSRQMQPPPVDPLQPDEDQLPALQL